MNRKIIFLFAVVIVMVAIFFVVKNSGKVVDEKEKIAFCLKEKDAVMYGVYYCGWCKKQKEVFGNAFKHINYVECTQTNLCKEKNILGYPTWEINGKLYIGFKTLDELKKLVGCK